MKNNVLSRKLGNHEGVTKVTYLATFLKMLCKYKKYGSKKDRSHQLSQKTNGRKYMLSI